MQHFEVVGGRFLDWSLPVEEEGIMDTGFCLPVVLVEDARFLVFSSFLIEEEVVVDTVFCLPVFNFGLVGSRRFLDWSLPVEEEGVVEGRSFLLSSDLNLYWCNILLFVEILIFECVLFIEG